MPLRTAILTLFAALMAAPLATACPTPCLVGPDVISTEAREFAFTEDPQSSAVYFNRVEDGGIIHIWQVTRTGDRWGTPTKLSISDDRFMDVDPFVSRSGDRLYFSSLRPHPNAKTDAPSPVMNTWYLERTDDGWSAPVFAAAPLNADYDDVFVSEDGEGTLYFIRFPEGPGRDNPTLLMSAQRTETGFSAPKPIPVKPDSLRVSNPAISADGKRLIVAGRMGDSAPDLYVSHRIKSGAWGPFKRIGGKINSSDNVEFAPYQSHDGKRLYFASNRPVSNGGGATDIYKVNIEAATFE